MTPEQRLATIRAVVDQQASDAGLWGIPGSNDEARVQQELRRLHEVIEGVTGNEIARRLLD